jgi:hypothetical protein
MIDPLSEVIALLQPRTVFSKRISGAGVWGVRYSAFGQPSFCAVLEGSCRLAVDGAAPATLEAGDFVLLPATPAFTLAGFERVTPERLDPRTTVGTTGEVRHGTRGGRPDVRILGGYFEFDSFDATMLVSLLPAVVHVRGVERLRVLVELVGEESLAKRSGRELVLTRLVEVLLIDGNGRREHGARPRALRPAPRRGAAGVSCEPDAPVDGERSREGGRHVALGILRHVRANGRRGAARVRLDLANGRGARSLAARWAQRRRGGRACGLRVGEHVQHGVPSSDGRGAGPIWSGCG